MTCSRIMATMAIIGLCAPLYANADRLVPGQGRHGVITHIGSGIVEFGIDNMLIIRSNSDTFPAAGAAAERKESSLEAIFLGGPTARYFIMDNLSLPLNVNAYVGDNNTESTSSCSSAAVRRTIKESSPTSANSRWMSVGMLGLGTSSRIPRAGRHPAQPAGSGCHLSRDPTQSPEH